MTVDEFIQRMKSGNRRKVVYHFTDSSNIELIKFFGGIYSKKLQEDRGFSAVNPGGDAQSRLTDQARGIFNYVSLCLTNNHPMAFRCREDKRQPNQVYIEIKPEVLHIPGTLIALGLANSAAVPIIPLAEGIDQIDCNILYDDIGWSAVAMSRLEKIEVLVPNFVPKEYLIRTISPR